MRAVSRPQTAVRDAPDRSDGPRPAFRGAEAGLWPFLRSRGHHPPSGADPVATRPSSTLGPVPATFGWSFAGVDVHSTAAGVGSSRSARSCSEGETAEEPRLEMEGIARVGEAEFPADFVGPLQPGDVRAVPADFIGPPAPGTVRAVPRSTRPSPSSRPARGGPTAVATPTRSAGASRPR